MAPGKTKLDAAKRHYAQWLRKHPKDAEAWGQLGIINAQLGLYSEALKCFGRVLDANPRSVPAHTLMAQTLLASGQPQRAESSLRRALELDPHNPQAAFLRGQIAESQGRMAAAASCYRTVVEKQPAWADGLLALGRTVEAAGQYAEAEALYTRALQIEPCHVNALLQLGALCLKRGALARAIEHYQQATGCDPSSAQAYYYLGWTQSVLGNLEDALRNFKRASSVAPAYADAIGGEASIYATRGEYQEAYERVSALVEAGTVSVQIAVLLGDICGRLGICDQAIEYANRVLAEPNLTYDSRIALKHVLGKLHDARGEHDLAFEAYRSANEMQPKGPEPAQRDDYINRVIDVWNERLYRAAPGASRPGEFPVFIVGMPRSGTTLVEQILSAHPAVWGGGELPFMEQLVRELPSLMSSDSPYPECLNDGLDQSAVDQLAARYLDQLRALGTESALITDKMWANYEHLGLISLLFPRAKIIHCVRDPLDTCLSVYFQYFSGRLPWANDLERIARYYRGYRRLMGHWRSLLDTPILEVEYETLVQDQEAQIRNLLDFCALPWDARCLRFHDSTRATRTVSQEQVRKPMYASSIGRWKSYEAHISALKQILGGSAP